MAPRISDFGYVLLDLDGTLYPYEPAHAAARAAVRALLEERLDARADLVEEALEAGRSETHRRHPRTAAGHSRILYFQAALERLGSHPVPLARECEDAYWNRFLEVMRPFPELESFLSRLEPAKTCVVTDLTARIQHRKFERLGLRRWIGHIVTSEEAGVEKPDSGIFQMALDKLGATPEESCMVGDSFERDVLGASRLGIHSFWLTRRSAVPEAGGLVTAVSNLAGCHG